MGVFLYPPIAVESTANSGQLLTTGDTTPAHRTGTTYFDRSSGKGYVYAYNGTGGTMTANSIYGMNAYYSASTTDYDVAVFAITDLAVTGYIVVPAAAIVTTSYGWFLYKGDNAAVAGLANETRQTAGCHVRIHDAAATVVAAGAWGVVGTIFATVRVVNTTSTTVGNLHFIGREILSTT